MDGASPLNPVFDERRALQSREGPEKEGVGHENHGDGSDRRNSVDVPVRI
jgi:hypothetical protein